MKKKYIRCLPKKNYRKVVYSSILVVVCVLLLSVAYIAYKNTNKSIATVDGEPISMSEFRYEMDEKAAEVHDYFQKKYKVKDGTNFWTTPINNEIPIEVLKKSALDECINIKVQQIIAKENNIVNDISYSGFLKSLKEENARRKEALDNNTPIYGPEQFGEREYYEYTLSIMQLKVKEKLGNSVLSISDDDLKSHYNIIKSKFYEKQDYIKTQKITILFNEKTPENEAIESIKAIEKRLQKGDTVEKLAKDFKQVIKVEEQIFDETTARNDSKMQPEVLDMVSKLKAGDISEVYKTSVGVSIFKCIETKESGFKDFEDVKINVKQKYVEEQFAKLIDQKKQEAQIQIVEKKYRNIKYE